MQNITLSAEKDLIERARLRARRKKTTLNAEFRNWLRQYTRTSSAAEEYVGLMDSLRHVRAGRKFSRSEMNER